MRIPRRFAPLLFGALLSAIMVCVVSAAVLVVNHGIQPDFFRRWIQSLVTTWLIAFPTVTFVAPWVRQAVARVTE